VRTVYWHTVRGRTEAHRRPLQLAGRASVWHCCHGRSHFVLTPVSFGRGVPESRDAVSLAATRDPLPLGPLYA
jgi:hypothetical protein